MLMLFLVNITLIAMLIFLSWGVLTWLFPNSNPDSDK